VIDISEYQKDRRFEKIKLILVLVKLLVQTFPVKNKEAHII